MQNVLYFNHQAKERKRKKNRRRVAKNNFFACAVKKEDMRCGLFFPLVSCLSNQVQCIRKPFPVMLAL